MFGRRAPVHRQTTRSAHAKLTEGVKRACETCDSVLDLATSSDGYGALAPVRRTAADRGDLHPAFGATRGRLPRRAFWDTLLYSGAPST